MNLHPIDWLVVAVPMILVLVVASYTRRHVKCASDFLSGGRIARRYLVAVSDGVAAMGLITVVSFFEFYYKAGFAVNHWGQIQILVVLILALTGFVFYRFRETRALTLAQFFELRYSRQFRLFSGWLAAIAGIINYGIFPAVAARFFIHYVNLPEQVSFAGISISTFALCMFVFLGIALVVVLFGGQMAIMVSDCMQGMLTFLMFAVVTVVVLVRFRWIHICEALTAQPVGESMLNPYDSFKTQDFNIAFVIIGAIGTIYITMAWQGNQGYNCAAATPHEAKMGKILGGWRGAITYGMILLLTVSAFTYLNHAEYHQQSLAAQNALAAVEDDTIRTQVQVPVAIAHFLPAGVSGMFLAAMLFLMLSTDTTYLHSWGSMIVQDIILPLRKKPFTPKGQLRYLRLSITAVAVFVFFFSLLFKQNTYILMFFAITGAIYLGGAGSCIIGGLYWKRGTTAAAWATMLTGAVVAIVGHFLVKYWPEWKEVILWSYPDSKTTVNIINYFMTGQVMWGLSYTTSILVYVIVSLRTCRTPFNMDRLLHRGKYAIEDDSKKHTDADGKGLFKIIGIDKQFNRTDRGIAYFVFVWGMVQFVAWAIITIWNMFSRWPIEWWSTYFWVVGVGIVLVGSILSGIWFTWGGIVDLRHFFRGLKTLKRNTADDGRVIGHINADEVKPQ